MNGPHPSRAAALVLLVSAVFLVAVFLLNKSLFDANRRFESRTHAFNSFTSMLGRSRAYRSHNKSFYQALLFVAVNPGFGSYSTSFSLDGTLSWKSDFGKEFERNRDEVIAAIEDFADRIPICLQFSDSATREQRVDELMQELAKRTGIKVREGIAHALSMLVESEGQRQIPYWIVFGDWPPPSFSTRGGGGEVSYFRHYPSWGIWEEENQLYALLQIQGISEAEKFLTDKLEKLRDQLRLSSRDSGKIAIPSSGMSVDAADALIIAGPLLVVIQLYFFVVRTWKITEHKGSERFLFPQFQSPHDPLAKPIPKNTYELAQRLIWGLFLLFPILLLACGVFFRYDLVTVVTPGGWSPGLLEYTFYQRDDDPTSNFVDGVNVISFAALLWLLYLLTHRREGSTKRYQLSWAGVLIAGLLPSWPLRVALISLTRIPSHPNQSMYSVVFAELVLAAFLVFGMSRKAYFLMATCGGILLVLSVGS
jgi:hypothetical protein